MSNVPVCNRSRIHKLAICPVSSFYSRICLIQYKKIKKIDKYSRTMNQRIEMWKQRTFGIHFGHFFEGVGNLEKALLGGFEFATERGNLLIDVGFQYSLWRRRLDDAVASRSSRRWKQRRLKSRKQKKNEWRNEWVMLKTIACERSTYVYGET